MGSHPHIIIKGREKMAGGREKYDLRRCLKTDAPQYVDNQCYDCGGFHKTSVRALAEGNDTCKKCSPERRTLKAYTSLLSIPVDQHRTYIEFYHAVWHWINNRTPALELKMNQKAGTVLFHIGKVFPIAEEAAFEEAEIKILQTLFRAYIHWKLEQTKRSWKQLFYAFWQTEHFYRGGNLI